MKSTDPTVQQARTGLLPPGTRIKVPGSAIFTGSNLVASAVNYLSNLVIARWLGSAVYADASTILTLALILSFATMTITLTTARFVAKYSAEKDEEHLRACQRWLRHSALKMGIGLLVSFGAGAVLLQNVFRTASAWPFVILGAGLIPFTLAAVERGILQGDTRFERYAFSLQVETWIRFCGMIIFVLLGWSVNGVALALLLSFAGGWFSARSGEHIRLPGQISAADTRGIMTYARSVVLVLLGQVIINNSDVLQVKHLFSSDNAGQYAVLALVGRIIFFASWPIVMVMFPLAARKAQRNEQHRYLLTLSLISIAVLSLGFILVLAAVPDSFVNLIFGPEYLPIAPLLWVYALATTFYTLANAVVSYRLSVRAANNYLLLMAGVIQIAFIEILHRTLSDVVWIQVCVMLSLFLVVRLEWPASRTSPLMESQE